MMKRQELFELAQKNGFNRMRIAHLERPLGIEAYDRYLSKGYHGTMSWMVRSRPPRANPKLLLPSAKTVIVLGVDYFYPRPSDPGGLTGMVSRYAWGRDYHRWGTALRPRRRRARPGRPAPPASCARDRPRRR